MTYNFDPERWCENEYSALEALQKKGNISDIEFEKTRSALLQRYEEMLSRLDGTFNCQNDSPLVIDISSFSKIFLRNRIVQILVYSITIDDCTRQDAGSASW